MTKAQAGILASLPEQGRYVFFTLAGASTDLQDSLRKLQANVDGQQVVVGLGLQVLQQLDRKLPLMREFPRSRALSSQCPAHLMRCVCGCVATSAVN